MNIFLNWLASQRGATMVEYGLIAAGVALAIIATIFSMGDSLEIMFNSMSTAMSNAGANIEVGT
jgi:pilus assembly protein Flp/PilA